MAEENNTNLPDTKYDRTKRTQTLSSTAILCEGQKLDGLSQKIEFKNPANGVEKAQILSVTNSSEKEPHILLAVTREGNEKPVAVFEKSESGKIVLRLEKGFANSFAGVKIEKNEAGEYFSYDMTSVAFSQTKGIETAQVSGAGEVAFAISAIGAVIKDSVNPPAKVMTESPFNIALTKEFLQMSLSKEANGCTMQRGNDGEPLFSNVMVAAIQLERQNQPSTKKEEVVSLDFGDVKLHSVPIKNPDGTVSYLNMKEEGGKVSAYVQLEKPNDARTKTQAKFQPINSVRLAEGAEREQTIQSIVVEFGTGAVAGKRTIYIDANFEENKAFINLMNKGGMLEKAEKKADDTLGADRAEFARPFDGHSVEKFNRQTSTSVANFDNVGVLTVEEIQPETEKDDGKDDGVVVPPIQPEPTPISPAPEPTPQPAAPDFEGPSVGYDAGFGGSYNIIPPNSQPNITPDDENPPINPAPQPEAPTAPSQEEPSIEEPVQEEPSQENPAAPAQPQEPAQEEAKEKPKEASKPLWQIKELDPKKRGLLYGITAVCVALSCIMPLPFAILTLIMGIWAVSYDLGVLNSIKKFLNDNKTKAGKDKENTRDKELENQLSNIKQNKKETIEEYNQINSEITELENTIPRNGKLIDELTKKKADLRRQVERLEHQEKAVQASLDGLKKAEERESAREEVKNLELQAKKIDKTGTLEEVKAFNEKLENAYHKQNALDGEMTAANRQFLEETQARKNADGSGVELDERGYISTGDDFEAPKTQNEIDEEKWAAIESMDDSQLTPEQLALKKKRAKRFKKSKDREL